MKAGIKFRNNFQDLEDHLNQFYNGLQDQELAKQLTVHQYGTIEELEKALSNQEKLMQRYKWRRNSSSHQFRNNTVKDQDKKVHFGKDRIRIMHASSSEHEESDTEMDQIQQSILTMSRISPDNVQHPTKGQNVSSLCDHCKKKGHSRNECFQLMKCSYCQKLGHPNRYCVEKANKLLYELEQWLKKDDKLELPENIAKHLN